jgi:hypothetical protein
MNDAEEPHQLVIDMKTHEAMVREWMEDPDFVRELRNLEPEFVQFDALFLSRPEAQLEQAEKVASTGITQPQDVANGSDDRYLGPLAGAFPDLASLTEDDLEWASGQWQRGIEQQLLMLASVPTEASDVPK